MRYLSFFLIFSPTPHPKLFVFSTSDQIVSSEDIENVIKAMENQSCDVTKICYDDTEHCQHLDKHQEAYVEGLKVFLQKALDGFQVSNDDEFQEKEAEDTKKEQ